MWICLNDGFFSIVEHNQFDDILMVRGRFKGDIERVFNVEEDDVIVTEDHDYMYRVFLPRGYVSEVMADEVNRINYGNFKNSISENENWRYRVYTKVWTAMVEEQDIQHPHVNPYGNWWETYRYQNDNSGTGYVTEEQLEDKIDGVYKYINI